jgi:hypothetical protein
MQFLKSVVYSLAQNNEIVYEGTGFDNIYVYECKRWMKLCKLRSDAIHTCVQAEQKFIVYSVTLVQNQHASGLKNFVT